MAERQLPNRGNEDLHLNRLGRPLLSVCLLLGCTFAGCDLALVGRDWDRYPSQIEMLAVARPSDPAVLAQQRGQSVYDHYCQICHGADGRGNGFNAAMLDPPPRNFADETFWAQTTDEQLFETISQGGSAAQKSVLMPAWGHTLQDQQIHDAIAYLRTVPEQVQAKTTTP